MDIFSRHFTKALLAATLLVTFVLTFLVWIEQSIRFIDLITKKEMRIDEFALLMLYLIPDLLGIILPVAFALSCGVVLTRLRETNQLTIIQSAGLPLSSVAFTVIKVGSWVIAFLYLVNFYFAPYSLRQFKSIQFHINQDVERLFSEGNLLNLEGKVAVFVKKISKGQFYGVAVFDQRSAQKQIVIQAEEGCLRQNGPKSQLILKNGERASINLNSGTATRFRFRNYSSDISLGELVKLGSRDLKIYERYIYELFDINLFGPDNLFEKKMQAEGHQRIIAPWLTLIFALVCFLIVTTHDKFRQGTLKSIVIAGTCIISVQGFNLAAFNLSHKYWQFNIVNYAGIITILILVMLLVFKPESGK
ncbi:MAG: LptF/LptG family permease [Holosporales bacterium]|nr:LptF/LptG family permease [Holosporales bacterium]